jgi:hypothetical protein
MKPGENEAKSGTSFNPGTVEGETVSERAQGFPFGIGRGDPIVPPGDEWSQPMTDEQAEDWLEGR